MRAERSESVVWVGADELKAEVQRVRHETELAFAKLLDRLVRAEKLAKSDAEDLTIEVPITIVDLRDDTSTPLPAIEGTKRMNFR